MYQFTSSSVDLDQLRTRLQRMSDEQLRRFGNAAKYMCSRKANLGKPPMEAYVIQLNEARLEWQRRHPKQ